MKSPPTVPCRTLLPFIFSLVALTTTQGFSAGHTSFTVEEVLYLNAQGICPIGRTILPLGAEGVARDPVAEINPFASQWTGTFHMKTQESPDSSGMPPIHNIVLTCKARVPIQGRFRRATGDMTLTRDNFADALGNAWHWSYDAKSKWIFLTPVAGYGDQASIDNDAPTLLPVGYRFTLDWSQHMTFTSMVGHEELMRILEGLYRNPEPLRGKSRKKKPHSQSAALSKTSSKTAASGATGKIPRPEEFVTLSQIPGGTSPEARLEHYEKIASILRQYHDRGGLNEKEAFRVLIRKGVMSPERHPAIPWMPSTFAVTKYQGKFRWPLDAGIVSSEFGRRWGRNHDGIDIAAALHEPVFAAAAGQVLYAGDGLRGYGNVVILRHDAKMVTLYAHNTSLVVRDGDWVHMGQLIALLGSTGHSTGPHVHFEIRLAGQAINPRLDLPKPGFRVRP